MQQRPAANAPTGAWSEGNDTITGSAYGDCISAGGGANVIDAGAGTDYVTVSANAGLGASIVVTTDGDTVLVTQAGAVVNSINNAEAIIISAGAAMGLTIDASAVHADAPGLNFAESASHDIITGSMRADGFITVSATNAQLGNDVYTGNGGAGLHSFTNGGANRLDGTTITDFDADDTINLSGNTLVNALTSNASADFLVI